MQKLINWRGLCLLIHRYWDIGSKFKISLSVFLSPILSVLYYNKFIQHILNLKYNLDFSLVARKLRDRNVSISIQYIIIDIFKDLINALYACISVNA